MQEQQRLLAAFQPIVGHNGPGIIFATVLNWAALFGLGLIVSLSVRLGLGL